MNNAILVSNTQKEHASPRTWKILTTEQNAPRYCPPSPPSRSPSTLPDLSNLSFSPFYPSSPCHHCKISISTQPQRASPSRHCLPQQRTALAQTYRGTRACSSPLTPFWCNRVVHTYS